MLGGRSMGPLVTALTLQTTAMSGFMFMGGPSEAYALGYFAIFYAVGDGAGGMINLTVLGRRMRRLSQLLDDYLPDRISGKEIRIRTCKGYRLYHLRIRTFLLRSGTVHGNW